MKGRRPAASRAPDWTHLQSGIGHLRLSFRQGQDKGRDHQFLHDTDAPKPRAKSLTWREARLASAFAMGAVDIAALAANAASFALLWAYRKGDANMRSAWICTRNYLLGNRAVASCRTWCVRNRHRLARRHHCRDHGRPYLQGESVVAQQYTLELRAHPA